MNVVDFRPNQLEYRKHSETVYYMEITHKETGVKVVGKGDHQYKLECDLLEKLREKLCQKQKD